MTYATNSVAFESYPHPPTLSRAPRGQLPAQQRVRLRPIRSHIQLIAANCTFWSLNVRILKLNGGIPMRVQVQEKPNQKHHVEASSAARKQSHLPGQS